MAGFMINPQVHSGVNPADINRDRKLAEAMLARAQGTRNITHPMQGVAQMVEALMGGMKLKQADAAQSRASSAATGKFNNLVNSVLGSSQPTALTPATHSSTSGMDAEIGPGIVSTANSLGIDPLDLATAISYETAGTFDPAKRGPTTKWGQHRGLIQFGEPQAKKYGVDWNDPLASQLGADGAVANYLRDTGVKPGMGLMDVYSAINAGGVGRYGRSDAAAGGAPGTVADKVNNQMAGHRTKAEALLNAMQNPVITPTAGPLPPAGPTDIVPNTDAVAPVPAIAPPSPGAANRLPGQLAFDKQYAGIGQVPHSMRTVAGGIPSSMTGSQPAVAPVPAVAAPSAGGVDPSPAPGGSGITPEMLAVLGDPHLTGSQRRIAEAILMPRLKPTDPHKQQLQQLQLEKLRKDLARPANRETVKGADGFNYYKDTGERVLPGVEAKPEKPPKPTTAIQEYRLAKEQGFAGSFLDYKKAIKGGMSIEVSPDGSFSFNTGGTANAGRSPKKLSEKLAGSDAKLLDSAREAATASENLDSVATQMEQVIGNVGYTGPGGDAYGAVDDLIGILAGDSGARGAFRSMAMEAQLSFTEKTKGAITDREMGMFREAVPNLTQRPEGNKEIIKVIKAGAKRVRTRAEFYEKFLEKNGSLQNAQAAWNRYMDENPMIVGSGQPGRFSLQESADFTPYLDPSYEGKSAPVNPQQPSGGWSIKEVQ